MYKYNAIVKRVIDGDTIEVEIDLGFFVSFKATLRLLRIDTAEVRTKNLKEKKHGKAATQRVLELTKNENVVIETHSRGKYGRWLSEVFIPKKNRYLTDILLEENFAKKENY